MRILSLDASTTTIGLAVFDYTNFNDKKLIHQEFWKPPKKGDIFERLAKTREFIQNILQKYQPDKVVLEDIILFMKNKSSAKTISSLAILNRTVGLTVYNYFGKSPTLLNVMKIRHAIKLNKTIPKKEEIPNLVAEHLCINFPWIYNKKGKIKEENFDIADAIAVGLAFIKINDPASYKKERQKK